MTTKSAFKHLTSKRNWGKQCGLNSQQASSIKYMYKVGILKESRMIELLTFAGYRSNKLNWKLS